LPDRRRERRQHQRIRAEIDFYCYIDGLRFDSASIDVSSGGALLQTADAIRKNAMVMIIPKDDALKKFPVMLVGTVIRHHEDPHQGLGIQWLRCITREGIASIFGFMSVFPEFSQLTLPPPTKEIALSQVVGYDFVKNRFYVPRIPEAAPLPAPEKPAAAVGTRPAGWRPMRPASTVAPTPQEAAPSVLPPTRPVGPSAETPSPSVARSISSPPEFATSPEAGAGNAATACAA